MGEPRLVVGTFLIYPFDDPRRTLRTMLEAFEVLTRWRVSLGQRVEASLGMSVHHRGAVYAWAVEDKIPDAI